MGFLLLYIFGGAVAFLLASHMKANDTLKIDFDEFIMMMLLSWVSVIVMVGSILVKKLGIAALFDKLEKWFHDLDKKGNPKE